MLVSVYLTRKCSLRCKSCMIWKTHRRELPPKEWAEIFRRLYDSLGWHISMIGGEPLEYWRPFEGLLELVRMLKGVNYSITSNSLTLTWDRAKKLVEAGLMNWTVSINYPRALARMYAAKDPRVYAGWRALEWFKRLGVNDLHATVTLYPDNVQYFPHIVRDLMEMEVWIEPTFVMWAKAPWYDSFPASCKPVWKPEHVKYIQEALKMLKKYKYFHGLPEMFEGKGLEEMLNASVRCGGKMHVLMVDEDGYVRLCRDIPGRRVRRWKATDFIDREEDLLNDWRQDYEEFCRGCNWDCVWQSMHGFKRFIHTEVRR